MPEFVESWDAHDESKTIAARIGARNAYLIGRFIVLIFLENAKVMAAPLAGATVETEGNP